MSGLLFACEWGSPEGRSPTPLTGKKEIARANSDQRDTGADAATDAGIDAGAVTGAATAAATAADAVLGAVADTVADTDADTVTAAAPDAAADSVPATAPVILYPRSVPRKRDNPPNRFEAAYLEWEGEPPPADLCVHEEQTKNALSENKSPDIDFRWSVNPYRGCFHGCAYCYARPTHPYLGFGAGTDFERQIVVKVNIVERLRAALSGKSWRHELVAFSGNTDCYQPLEANYRLTRGCLEVCSEHQTPIAIITKGKLVRRDVDVLQELQRRAGCRVALSIPFADEEQARAIEPFASPPSTRFETLRLLSEAGIDTAVALAPIIPGLNDDQIPEILKRARDAGASSAFKILLRLPLEVGPIFDARLREAFPFRHDKVMSAISQVRGGRRSDSRFGARMVGQGPRWSAIEQLFATHCDRLGLEHHGGEAPRPPAPRERTMGRQLPLLF